MLKFLNCYFSKLFISIVLDIGCYKWCKNIHIVPQNKFNSLPNKQTKMSKKFGSCLVGFVKEGRTIIFPIINLDTLFYAS